MISRNIRVVTAMTLHRATESSIHSLPAASTSPLAGWGLPARSTGALVREVAAMAIVQATNTLMNIYTIARAATHAVSLGTRTYLETLAQRSTSAIHMQHG